MSCSPPKGNFTHQPYCQATRPRPRTPEQPYQPYRLARTYRHLGMAVVPTVKARPSDWRTFRSHFAPLAKRRCRALIACSWRNGRGVTTRGTERAHPTGSGSMLLLLAKNQLRSRFWRSQRAQARTATELAATVPASPIICPCERKHCRTRRMRSAQQNAPPLHSSSGC